VQIVIIALALFILWWILRDHYRRGTYSKSDKPIDILNKRYAAGEITKEEYSRIKKDLE
jgi:putative membrane protein